MIVDNISDNSSLIINNNNNKSATSSFVPTAYPCLLVLRYISALHLLLSAIFPEQQWLTHTASLQVSFLIFLSGFTLTHNASSSHHLTSSSTYQPQSFYLTRFSAIVPFHIISLFIHACFFSTSSHPFTRAFYTSFFLSPYLSNNYVFPPHDSPYVAPNLLPSIILAYIVFPPLLQLFPRITNKVGITTLQNQFHNILLLFIFYSLTAIQAFWLSKTSTTILSSSSSSSAMILFDYIVYIPFSTNLPAFLFGVVVALFRLAKIPLPIISIPFSSSSLTTRLLRFVFASALLIFSIAICIPFLTNSTNPSWWQTFFSVWFASGLLLPFFALVTCTASSISSFPFVQSSSSSSSSPFSSSSTFFSRLVHHASRFCLTYYLTAAPLFRFLSSILCSSSNNNNYPTFHFICLDPISSSSSSYDLILRPLWVTSFYGPRISPFLFLPCSFLVSLFIYIILVAPTLVMFHYFINHIVTIAKQQQQQHSILISYIVKTFFDSKPYQSPQRNLSTMNRIFRIVLYYLGITTFAIFIFNLTLPPSISTRSIYNHFMSIIMNDKQKTHWYCSIFNNLQSCHQIRSSSSTSLSESFLTIWTKKLQNFMYAFRWVALINVPPTLFTLLGHLIHPRAIWKSYPSLTSMLAQEKEEDHDKMMISDTRIEEGITIDDRCKTKCIDNNNNININNQQNQRYHQQSFVNNNNYNNQNKLDMNFVLYLRYVTRGNNPNLVARNVQLAINVMNDCCLSPHKWCIEVVTDRELNIIPESTSLSSSCIQTNQLVVPSTYQTNRGTKFKARALQYAIEMSQACETDWIVHLDEETTFDKDTIHAILYHCGTESYRTFIEKSQKWPRIGQGLLIYGRSLCDIEEPSKTQTTITSNNNTTTSPWILTLADCNRVADDCGRFRLQYECGEVWCGMHGSFVIVNNLVEKSITFDHGLEGSIAEDAFFALKARSKGIKFSWIDAIMFEQSPFTWVDFLRQRARWLVGGILVVTSRKIPLIIRSTMSILIMAWICTPFTYTTAIVLGCILGTNSYFHGTTFGIAVALLTTISIWNYVFGFFVSFSWKQLGLIRFLVFLYVLIVSLPMFAVMEVMSVIYAIWNFNKTAKDFHIVQKDNDHDNNNDNDNQNRYGAI